jgi:hypothetical protein
MNQTELLGGIANLSLVNQLDDSTTPRIIKNIERVSIRYREYVKSETDEELNNESVQIQKIKELRKKERKETKKT